MKTGFIADTHTYYLDGQEVPSVTGIDKILATEELDRWFQKRIASEAARTGKAASGMAILDDRSAAERGTAVHSLVENFIRRGERPESRKYAGYFGAFENFVQIVRPRWLETEVQVFSREHRYAGTLDFMAETPDFGVVIGDWKTAKRPYQSMARQLSAYKHAEFYIRENDGEEFKLPSVDALLIVLLGVEGSTGIYRIVNDTKHFADFTRLRSLYNSVRVLNAEAHWTRRVTNGATLVSDDSTWYCHPLDDDRVASEREESPVSAEELHKALSEHFPRQVIGTLNKGGTRLDYIPIAEVITRLNKALGIGCWGTQVISVGRDATDPDWVVAHVRLTVNVQGTFAAFDQFGGQRINRTKAGAPVDLGDDFKGAVSDGIKKCAQQLGVGLELARKEEALRYEEKQEAQAAKVLASPEEITKLRASIDALPTEPRNAFREWWKKQQIPPPDKLPAAQLPQIQGYLDEIHQRIIAKKEASAAESNGKTADSETAQTEQTEEEAVALVGQAFPGAEQVPGGEPF